ncbi:glycosyltransferase family 4 protein [Vibrio sp. MA64]|uniref:glycosyltransferase family 4 protein n=1 Tax=Vibrio sp. MA64 TaxID=2896365 RepID=UPI001E43B190|nr:glycosyltransferase family 4 protein [Vibrio sp. MA64]MCC9651538.1 glycosyltransferase family 4 protein [Vibrio sp. MA64]
MKIVICTTLYPLGGRQGAMGVTDAIRTIAQGLSKNMECTVSVVRMRAMLSRDGIHRKKTHKDENIRVYDYPIFPCASLDINWMTRWINRDCYKLLKDSDHIVCHMADHAFRTCLLYPEFRHKIIYVIHANDVLQPEFMKYALKHCSKVLTRTDRLKRIVEPKYISKIKGTVFSGIKQEDNVSLFDVEKNKVIYAGALIKRKNIDILIEGINIVSTVYPDIKLEIIGDGPEFNKLSSINAKFDIKFSGSLPQDAVFERMCSSDIFVMPSVRETLGLVYLEAMNRMNKVIGTKGEGIDGIIVDGFNGFLIEELSAKSIADKIIEAIECDNSVVENARNTSKEYSVDQSIKNYKKLISK